MKRLCCTAHYYIKFVTAHKEITKLLFIKNDKYISFIIYYKKKLYLCNGN